MGSKPQSSYLHQRVSASLSSAAHSNVRSLCTALTVLVFPLVISSIASAFVTSIEIQWWESRAGARAAGNPAAKDASVGSQTGSVGC